MKNNQVIAFYQLNTDFMSKVNVILCCILFISACCIPAITVQSQQ